MANIQKQSDELIRKILADYSGDKAKRITTVNLLLSFSAGNQAIETSLNVPYRVGEIRFNPPVNYHAAAANVADNYLLYSNINNGIVGVIHGEYANSNGNSRHVVSTKLINPTEFSGVYKFWIRSFTEAGGGAVAELATKVWLSVEFHEA